MLGRVVLGLTLALAAAAVLAAAQVPCENYVASGTAAGCQTCLAQGGSACKYCNGAGSRFWGCVSVTNNTVCQDEDDSFISSAGSCPDNCISSADRSQCKGCIEDNANCGYCEDGAGCRTGTAAGIWSSDISNCQIWRWRNRSINYQPRMCRTYENCDEQTTCSGCLGTSQDANTVCGWCSSGDGETGTCMPMVNGQPAPTCADTTQTLWTYEEDNDKCPSPPTNSATTTTPAPATLLAAGAVAAVAALAQ